MRPRPALVLLLIGFAAVLAEVRPARAFGAKAVWEGVAYLPGFSEELQTPVLLRYDLAARTWLEPVSDPLLDFPHQIEIDEVAAYALDRYERVIRLPHDGSPATVLAEGSPAAIGAGSGRLFVLDSKGGGPSIVRTLDRTTGAVLGERELPLVVWTFAVAAAERRVVFSGARDLFGVDYADDGSLGEVVEPEPLGPRGSAFDLVAFPDGRRVLDPLDGQIYDARTLHYAGSVPAYRGRDAAFGDGSLFVLSDQEPLNQLVGFVDGTFAEIGRVPHATWADPKVFVHAGNVFIFSWPNGEAEVAVHAVDALAPPPLQAPADPATTTYDPRQLAVTTDDVVLARSNDYFDRSIFESVEARQLFRFSLAERAPLPSVPLRGLPMRFLYDGPADALYLFYPDRRITRIAAPGGAAPVEVPFAVAPFVPGTAARLGERLLVADNEGSDGLFAFSAGGAPLRIVDPGFDFSSPHDLAASSAAGRIYAAVHSNLDTLTVFGLDAESRPVEELFTAIPGSWTWLRPSADGALVFDGFFVRDGATLGPVSGPIPLPWDRYGAEWYDGALVLLESSGSGPVLRRLTPPFATSGSSDPLPLPGNSTLGPLVSAGDGLLLSFTTWGSGRFSEVLHYEKIFPGPDLDGDGVSNGSDLYPFDPIDSADRDGDGTGDNADAFPDDERYASDRDGDAIADEHDDHPDDPELAAAYVSYTVGVTVPPYGFLRGRLGARTYVFEDGTFAICPETAAPESCMPGTFERRRNSRLELTLLPEIVDAFEAGLEEQLEEAFQDLRGRPVDLSVQFRRDKLRLTGAIKRHGDRLRFDLRFPYVATTKDLRVHRIRGVFRIRGEADSFASFTR